MRLFFWSLQHSVLVRGKIKKNQRGEWLFIIETNKKTHFILSPRLPVAQRILVSLEYLENHSFLAEKAFLKSNPKCLKCEILCYFMTSWSQSLCMWRDSLKAGRGREEHAGRKEPGSWARTGVRIVHVKGGCLGPREMRDNERCWKEVESVVGRARCLPGQFLRIKF